MLLALGCQQAWPAGPCQDLPGPGQDETAARLAARAPRPPRHGSGTARHGTARHGMVGQGTARHGTARHGTARQRGSWLSREGCLRHRYRISVIPFPPTRQRLSGKLLFLLSMRCDGVKRDPGIHIVRLTATLAATRHPNSLFVCGVSYTEKAGPDRVKLHCRQSKFT